MSSQILHAFCNICSLLCYSTTFLKSKHILNLSYNT